jgi:hypothetical protein
MSTKIVSTASKPLNGEINKDDLHKIHEDYIKLVKLDSTSQRHFKKTDGFYLSLDILKSFIQQAENAGSGTKIFCRFGVTLPDQKTCYAPHADIANNLTVIFFIADKNDKIKDHVGDGVLTAGFKASSILSSAHEGLLMGDDGDLTCCGAPHGHGQ